ncbi:hypothetical protein N7510_008604 [Penicillium lagena]|uniref:uncharacterized protein n=1 Tax=Penicillium lagena TaxID=94218 RepID=UPI002540D837|nr:uncharacterized protein N7510_008604 [Penicillium lagena]KAJ5605823.1 hypothetical protein N7510_008604 [Penicillium lagena]
MRATTFLFGAASLLAATPSVWAATSQCVQTCETSHPAISMCTGSETGKALAECTCASFTAASPMIKCIKQCPTADQSQYAAGLPSLCRGELFPGVKVSSATTTSASGGATSASASPSQTTPASATTTNGAAINAPTQIAMVGAVLAGLLV